MQKKKQKKEKGYAVNKKAFDSVLSAYRSFSVITVGVNMPMVVEKGEAVDKRASSNPSRPADNPMMPTTTDFRCDVDRAVKLRLKTGITMSLFRKAYAEYDSDDTIELELHAQAVLGSRRHSVEQRLGAEFIRRKLYPVHGKGYFHVVR